MKMGSLSVEPSDDSNVRKSKSGKTSKGSKPRDPNKRSSKERGTAEETRPFFRGSPSGSPEKPAAPDVTGPLTSYSDYLVRRRSSYMEEPAIAEGEESPDNWYKRKSDVSSFSGMTDKTVVMLGLTGHGKSQLIKSLYRIFQFNEESTEIGIGDGNVSMTSDIRLNTVLVSTIHATTLREKDIRNWQAQTGRTSMDYQEEMLLFGGNDAASSDYYLRKYKAIITYGMKDRMKLNMVDVPGGSDSFKRDDDHFFELAKFLSHTGGVTAFVFTIMHGRVFDSHFQSLFNYYWNWLSDTGVPFIVVHTGWDPFMPRFKKKAQERVDRFCETFPNTAKVKHIFIDSLWYEPGDEDYEPNMHHLDQQKKAMAVRSFNELLEELIGHEDHSLHKLPFMKTEAMVTVDHIFRESAQTGICAISESLRNVEPELANTVKTIAELENRRKEAENRMEPIKSRLKCVDNDELVQIAEKDGGACHLWGWKTMKMTTQYPIAKVEAVEYTTAKWSKVTHNGCVATGQISSGACPRFTWGSLVAYAKSGFVHQEEIKSLKAEMQPLLRELAAAASDHARECNREKELSRQADDAHLQLMKLSLVMRICTMPSMSVDAFVKLFPLYQAAEQESMSKDLFHENMIQELWAMREELALWDPFIMSILQPANDHKTDFGVLGA